MTSVVKCQYCAYKIRFIFAQKWPGLKDFFLKSRMHTCCLILLIRDMGLDVEIVSNTTKPYILQKILNKWICCKYLAWYHGLKTNSASNLKKINKRVFFEKKIKFQIGISTSKFLIWEKKFSFSPQKCKLELCMSNGSKVPKYLSFLLFHKEWIPRSGRS